MFVSLEISLYPLRDDPKPIILDYISALSRQNHIRIESNRMSTQLFGEYDDVMDVVQQATKKVFEQYPGTVLMSKLINTDRSPN